jgi:Cys-rich repeat protein
MPRTLRSLTIATLIAAVSQAGGCFATPLPDPPSLTTSAMTLVEAAQPDRLIFSGADGAVGLGAIDMRVRSSSGGTAVVATSSTGSFRVTVGGTITDVLYLEEVVATGPDVFLGAVRSAGGGAVAPVPETPDLDGDGSPDAIDCDPIDRDIVSVECSCASDADCAAMGGAGRCISGTCTLCSPIELCGDGIDDDCNGLVDDGCAPPCATDADCAAGEMCSSGTCVTASMGAPCASDADCPPREICVGAGMGSAGTCGPP